MMPVLRPFCVVALVALPACAGWRDALSPKPYQNAGPGTVRGLDTGPADDTGAADTGPADTGATDTGANDTGANDTGANDTGPAPG